MTWAKAVVFTALGAAAATAVRADHDADIVSQTVYFTLKDPTRENIDKCLAACKKYASKHEGMIQFACGERSEPSGRPFVDKDFHVTQTIIYRSRDALENYMKSEERRQYVAECKNLWAKVRVFEVDLRGMETHGLKRVESNQ